MNVKFKDGVYGFIWDSGVTHIFTEELSEKERKMLYDVVDGLTDACFVGDDDDIETVITDYEDVDEVFLTEDSRSGLDKVLELVK